MKVCDLMIPEPITIDESASIQDAIETMKTNSIRHLPVADTRRRLKGFVTLADLKAGLLPSMIGDVTLADLIIREPIAVGPEDDVEIAAQLIYKHKIGGMPVVEDGRLVGIITETDMLRAFIAMMGILTSSSRLDVVIEEKPGAFKQATQIIEDSGGDVINVGMKERKKGRRTYYFRLSACKTAGIRKALEKEGFSVTANMD
jgi:acetoin utilization protein AcuB